MTVAVSNVEAADGGTGASGTIRVGFLLGDVSQNRVVTLSDLGQVNAQVAQFVTAANFLIGAMCATSCLFDSLLELARSPALKLV